ncbi:unnamed protein product [Closterium sp. Naga37s-1]|nr:unnamed protein product [Closterium sp. Naga37s-1]
MGREFSLIWILMIVVHSLLNIRHPVLGNGMTWFPLDSKAYVYATQLNKAWPVPRPSNIFALDYLAIPVIAQMLLLMHHAQLPTDDRVRAGVALKEAKTVLIKSTPPQKVQEGRLHGTVGDFPHATTPETPQQGRREGGGKPRSAGPKAKASAAQGEKKRGGTSEYSGVWFDQRVKKWCTKMVCDPTTGQQIRMGAYRKEVDAAYAWAAGAFVIRRKDTFPKVHELSDAEMAALEGCIIDDVRHLVQKRQWYRWREWRKAMDDIGVLPGTPFKPDTTADASTGDAKAGHNVTQDEAADEEMQAVDEGSGEECDGSEEEAKTP